jgi:hypothetical protein
MLKELAVQEFDQVIGGSTTITKLEGSINTIYRDEDGIVKCGTWPWPKPRPVPWGPGWPIKPPRPYPFPKPRI